MAAPPLMTVKEATAYLRLSETTVLELLRTGALAGRKVGNSWRIPTRRLIAFLDGETSGAD